jgi:nucleotide-binding universal stress UspA family protein
MASETVVIGYDGFPASERAIAQAGALLKPRRALVAVVWETATAFEAVEAPAMAGGLPPAPIDVRTALEIDEQVRRQAQQRAAQGAEHARAAGFEAEGLAVADDVTVADTLVRLADEHDASAIVVGHRSHGLVGDLLLGSNARALVRRAHRPVLVVGGPDDER